MIGLVGMAPDRHACQSHFLLFFTIIIVKNYQQVRDELAYSQGVTPTVLCYLEVFSMDYFPPELPFNF